MSAPFFTAIMSNPLRANITHSERAYFLYGNFTYKERNALKKPFPFVLSDFIMHSGSSEKITG